MHAVLRVNARRSHSSQNARENRAIFCYSSNALRLQHGQSRLGGQHEMQGLRQAGTLRWGETLPHEVQ